MNEERKRSNTGIRREELSVGLARNQKAESQQVPKWFVEYGGWIFAAFLLLGVLSLLLFVGDRSSGSDIAADYVATLVTVGPIHQVWEEGASNKVKSVQVRIGNTGRAPAGDVRVAVLIGAASVPLVGPKKIEPGASELYQGEVRVLLRSGQDLQISLRCANCR